MNCRMSPAQPLVPPQCAWTSPPPPGPPVTATAGRNTRRLTRLPLPRAAGTAFAGGGCAARPSSPLGDMRGVVALFVVAATLLGAARVASAALWTASTRDAHGSVAVQVNTTTGVYEVLIDGEVWLEGRPTAVHADGVWYSAATSPSAAPQGALSALRSGTVRSPHAAATATKDPILADERLRSADDGAALVLVGSRSFIGGDDLGSFHALSLSWSTAAGALAPHGSSAVTMETDFLVYDSSASIVFRQRFPQGANGTALGTSLQMLNELCTAFPRFDANGGRVPQLRYFGQRFFWDLDMVADNGARGLDEMVGGLYGGAPLMLFDASSDNLRSLVLSPLSNFKVGFQSRPAALGGDLAAGVHGRVLSLPPGFEHSTLLSVGAGVNAGLLAWGDTLLSRYGKTRYIGSNGDIASTLLAYTSDTGAAYWYNTMDNNTADYATTMLAVRDYHDSIRLPVRTQEWDSWWYYKGNTSHGGEAGGVKLWEARPDVFPRGMAKMAEAIGMPISLHYKYDAPDTVYAARWPFLVEENASIPLSAAFWDSLMSNATSWGTHMIKVRRCSMAPECHRELTPPSE